MVRKLIYTIEMVFIDDSGLNYTIATNDKMKLGDLVEQNKAWVERGMRQKVKSWRFISEDLSTLKMSITDYEEAIAKCDFVDGDDWERPLGVESGFFRNIPEMP